MPGYVDVHQHLWPAALVEELRRRPAPPMLRGWTLHTTGEPPYEVRPADHDPARRRALDAGAARVLVSLSSPLGIEGLPPDQARPLLAAWHAGVAALGAPFAGWAAVNHADPDTASVADELKVTLADAGPALVGLQVPADELATPAALERLAPVLRRCEELDRPVLVHPGPATSREAPGWWAAVVDYPAQLQAAWWSWQHAGRALLPALRICFVAGAGLAPVHHERFAARAEPGRLVVDRDAFVDTSSYRRQGVDALTRALGIDVVVLGSDRPYATPFPGPGEQSRTGHELGAAAVRAICQDNPVRLLEGDRR